MSQKIMIDVIFTFFKMVLERKSTSQKRVPPARIPNLLA